MYVFSVVIPSERSESRNLALAFAVGSPKTTVTARPLDAPLRGGSG
jgi:hypothetical protein